MTATELQGMTVSQLRDEARQRGLGGLIVSNGSKEVLVSVLSGEHEPAEWVLNSDGTWALKLDPAPAPAAPAPAPAPAPAINTEAAASGFEGMFGAFVAKTIDATVSAAIDRKVGSLNLDDVLRPIEVKLGEAPETRVVKGAHCALAKCLNVLGALANHDRNLFLTGPMGSGKSTLARHIAEAFGVACETTSLSDSTSEAAVFGRVIPNVSDGSTSYVESPFMRMYRNGGVWLGDEMDAADSNTLVALNAALANGSVTIPSTGVVVERHEQFVCVAAANTYGTGADRIYVGRNQLDGATMDRYVGAMIEVDYDRALERSLARGIMGEEREHDADVFVEAAWRIRERVSEHKLRRAVSTRFVRNGACLLRAGWTQRDTFDQLLTGWAADELAKVRKEGGES
jgi:cobaltochelatase CobS